MLCLRPALRLVCRPRTLAGHAPAPAPAQLKKACLPPAVRRFSTPPSARPPPPAGPPDPAANANAPKPKPTNDDVFTALRDAQRERAKKRNQSAFLYFSATFILAFGLAYAAVPFYRAFCSATGYGGTPIAGDEEDGRFSPSRLVPAQYDPDGVLPATPGTAVARRRIRVRFASDTSDDLPWSFTPSTRELHILPGETALAFFRAKNHSKKDIVGIATYNVTPERVAPYFAKVECFCFEQQRLLAGEEVDLPVFFFIDRDVLDDPTCINMSDVILSYTFFAARRNETTGDLEPDTDLASYTVGIDLPDLPTQGAEKSGT